MLAGVMAVSTAIASTDDKPSWDAGRALKGAGGAVLGGVAGAQVGKGKGRDLALGVGAATGAVLAVGCKPTAMSVVGGLLGGLIGSQVGDGKGRQVAIGVGSAVGAVLGSDCSADNAVRATVTTPRIGETIINGIPVGNGGVFELGRLSGLPPVQTVKDLRDLDRAVHAAQHLARARLEAGDYGGAMMATHFASLLLEYQALIGISNHRVFESMKSMRDGRVTIPAGAYAVLPVFDRGGYTHHERVDISFMPTESGEPILVASNGLLSGILDSLPKRSSGATSRKVPVTAEYAALPVGMTVTFANGLVMKRTDDSIVVHNPKGVDLDAELEKMGYMPPIPLPSKHRQDAGRIMKNMTYSSNLIFLRNATGDAWPKAPNLIVSNVPQVQGGLLNVDGDLAQSKAEDVAAKKLYADTKSSYRLAMDTLVSLQSVSEWGSFKNACLNGGYRTASLNAIGLHGEIAAFLCGSGRNVGSDVYSRQFYIGEKGLHMTLESIMRDEAVAQEVKRYSLEKDLASNLIQMIPLIGNFESGIKCSGSDFSLWDVYAEGSEKMKAAAFVKKIYDPQNLKDGPFLRTLDCMSAIPLVGVSVKGAAKAKELAGGLREYVTKSADDFYQISRVFDTTLVNGAEYAVLAEKASKYGDAWAAVAPTAKHLYDTVQRATSISEIAGSLNAVR